MKAFWILPLMGVLVKSKLDDDMGPAAFLWPSDRAFSAVNDNTAPCGSAAGVTNRTVFPMTNGAVAVVLQDESYNVNLAVSHKDNPTSNDDFSTLVSSSNFPDLKSGHECYSVPNAPSSVSPGSNATLQLSYISKGETDTNKTYYACADITYVALKDFTIQVPCFNVSIDNPTAVTSSLAVGATATATSTTAASTSSSTSDTGGSHLSGGAIAGIVVGTVVGGSLVLAALVILWRRRQQKARREKNVALKMNELTSRDQTSSTAGH
ncbi:hypothetical protein BGW36DRAFT_388482 [Talaromyces proteolyticus]|uniref:Copper acquisition factor BIM1-like domain-containing protein n=1 Tax=Talaromyces proteolyticus TaxID=1131652 RepID=A0AAD4KLZ3_9EURO|nr:uncharacterized protein BGW36DRAFT_388482 [Talaromyces proteolyticus]KAH8691527.1 hypothetical protein BGW36DRAFT_388482 [Talaromyces proteolyticus]